MRSGATRAKPDGSATCRHYAPTARGDERCDEPFACITVTVIIYFRDGNTDMKKPPVPLTPAVFHILLALADGPLHGYGIMQAVEASAANEPSMGPGTIYGSLRSEEHTSELQSQSNLVCRLLLE